ncbi:YhcN/YlaJ family sporulation lipoprotein [Paenibacillus pini]|uniref:Uncharacterized protein n=1 Tax=Paenibacillus pini JCM 16418 TaxID=1236976 RepID=W7YCR5_9BACL|nr:YhcN/YlaJ family sporulation lipoprotein [Paenibacillus pini]GAF08700.1 hypothetical protein JCM16418_2790 [Paenibacillus pini JCM 16418]
MADVSSANVLVSGNSAYVAVRLADNVSGPNMKSESYPSHPGNGYNNGTMRTKSMDSGPSSSFNNSGTSRSSSFNNNGGMGTMNNNNGGRGLYGTMGTGSYGIMRGLTTGRSTANNMSSPRQGFTGVDGMSNSTGMNNYGAKGNTGMYDKITRSNGYNATTYGTGGTTGGNMTSYSNENLPSHIKSKISAKVKQADPSIKNVYVSANPDFVQRVSNFSTDTLNGHPIKGMISEFSTMVERIFPINMNNNTHNQMITPKGNATTGDQMMR